MRVRRVVLLLLTASVACGGGGGVKDEELEGLVVSPPDEAAPVDPDRALTDGGELGRALAIPHHQVAGALGPHTVKVTSRVEITEGSTVVETLSDETTLALSADGRYHATYANSADYGREVIFDGAALYLRPRYARWHRRPPNDEDEAIAIRDQMYGVAGAYFEPFSHAAEVSDRGAAKVAGRDGRRAEIKRAPSPKSPPAQHLTQRKWRDGITVQELTGEAVLDAETATPLQARYAGAFTFVRDGRTFTMKIEVGHEVTSIGEPAADALAPPPPDQTVATPERLREVDDRDRLLEGIAPPTRRRDPAPAAAAAGGS